MARELDPKDYPYNKNLAGCIAGVIRTVKRDGGEAIIDADVNDEAVLIAQSLEALKLWWRS